MTKLINIIILITLIGCGNNTATKNTPKIFNKNLQPITQGSWYKPTKNTSWQWQLSGDINTSYNVEIYDIDLFDTDKSLIEKLKKDGKRVICYFSAGSYENWRSDKDDFPMNVLGKSMDGWDGEKWLDISNESLAPIIRARLDLAVEKGCDGVEPDNMDGYTNSTGFNLTANDQLKYNKFIANEARIRGLSVGLKNDLDQIVELEPYFDFAVNEQCHEFEECQKMKPFIDANKPVLNAEYAQKYLDSSKLDADNMCHDTLNMEFNTLVLPLNLDNSFRYSCSKEEAKLLFSSGFEQGVYIDQTITPESEDYRFIRGKDESGFSWPINILGSSDSALHYVGSDNFKAIKSEIQTVIGRDGKPTKALYNMQNYNTESTQLPYEILNIKDGKSDLYIRYWIKLDSQSLLKPDMWRTFFEYKTKDYDDGDGFRLISFIYTDADGIPYWHWQGDANPKNPIWEIDNKSVPVPMDEWFLTEFYWHWSDSNNGRALWKINGKVIGDHKGATTKNAKPIDFIMITQIYGNSNPKYQWIDDIEIWDGLPAK